jgi:hypothetical protein
MAFQTARGSEGARGRQAGRDMTFSQVLGFKAPTSKAVARDGRIDNSPLPATCQVRANTLEFVKKQNAQSARRRAVHGSG